MNTGLGTATIVVIIVILCWIVLTAIAPSPKSGGYREQITMQSFVHELWNNEKLARWQWWVIVMILIFKL